MEIMHIILMHNEPKRCEKCGYAALITPVNNTGRWRCPKCSSEQRIARINKKILAKAVWEV